MATNSIEPAVRHSPLEQFVRDYVEAIGGAWEEVEPQLYDVLLPAEDELPGCGADERQILRMAFDPEALPEHPEAQLASFGTPLIDRLLADALRRGRHARFYVVGLNLRPHDLTGRVRRALTLAPELELRLEHVRALDFAQAVFWFQATFVSDQKEQEIVPVAIDLHYRREARHLEQLLDRKRLAEKPSLHLPEARRSNVAVAYPIARERVLRTLSALTNTRSREVREHVNRQIDRMCRYYADLREELQEQMNRARSRDEDLAKFSARGAALDREERLRLAELRQKGALRAQLRLLNLLLLQQPKLLLRGAVASKGREVARLELVWDAMLESLEAVPCSTCGRPTFALTLTRQAGLVCPACAAAVQQGQKSARR